MWKNAAQMQIVLPNWWQYAGRVWGHANSAQPPNSHLAPKLKINTTHQQFTTYWWTWYCPSDLYTSSVCARPLTRRGMLSTRVRTLPGQTAATPGGSVSRAVCGGALSWTFDVHKVTSKHPRRPWQHLIPQDLDVPMPVHGPIHHESIRFRIWMLLTARRLETLQG